MATTVFQVTPYSSYRFVNENPAADPRYHTVLFDDRLDPTNYFQKVQKGILVGEEIIGADTNLRVQLLSDFVPTLGLYTCKDIFVKDVAFTSRTILSATFLVYDAVVDYSDVAEGSYYLKLTYTDEDANVQDLRTSPLNVADDWAGTLLLEYTNTYNDKGVIFVNDDLSLLVFGFRIESSFDEYQPLSDDIDYIDQVHDSEVLNNTPFDNEKLYIGTDQETGGAPDWAIKKMNLIFTLNKVSIDGQYYNRVEGSKFTPVRADYGTLINGENVRPTHWSIDIIPNLNFNLEQFKTGNIPTGDLIVIKKVWPPQPHINFTNSFIVPGIFSDNSNLIRIALWNYGLDAFQLLVGTTTGGSEIATFDIPNILTHSLDIGHPFNAATTVHVTLQAGVNVKAILDYNQYDAPPIDPNIPTSFGNRGMGMIYEEITPGDFVLDFDIGTGLGLRKYVGWALSGTNGTKERSDKYSRGWNRAFPSLRGTEVGNPGNQLVQTEAQVGRHRHLTPNSNDANGYGKPATGDRPQEGPDMFTNYNTDTTPDPMNISPDSWYDVWIIKITD